MTVRERFIARVMQNPEGFGLSEAKFIHTPQVFTSPSVRLRCQYHCSQMRQSDFVPPHTPRHDETRQILDEYKYGLMLRREEPFGQRPAGQMWQEFTANLLRIETESQVRGYTRAFAIGIGNCLYLHHDDSLRPCDFPEKRRPTLEALGVELHETLEMILWHQHLVRTAEEPFQMFALLLLE
jgi:predicted metal-binding protein